MRQIKFRGVDVKTGAYVFGDLIQPLVERFGGLLTSETPALAQIKQGTRYYDVDAESVKQLIGKDARGEEVYEDDKVYSHGQSSFRAKMNHIYTIGSYLLEG